MNDPPTHALDTTVTFLRSTDRVRQALHMAADEMRTITSDKWTDDVWGLATACEPITKLFFYFGRNDHWVAEQTRDEIIASRGQHDGLGPRMFICEEGLPHAFCLKDNDIMARKVAGMIREIRKQLIWSSLYSYQYLSHGMPFLQRISQAIVTSIHTPEV
ncbi:unnamed protein product [Penicillium pancosmium]